jgi:hypothetical protein
MLRMLACQEKEKATEDVEESNPASEYRLNEFVDLKRWAKEYFRGRFGMEHVDDDIAVVRVYLAWLSLFSDRCL